MIKFSTDVCRRLCVILGTFFFAGCVANVDSKGSNSASIPTTPYINSSDFVGAQSASNILTGIKVQWNQVTNGKSVASYRVYRVSSAALTRIATVSYQLTSYVDGNVQSGASYTYMVRAVDPAGNEDTNMNTVTGYAWSGLTGVSTPNNTSILVSFNPQLQGVYLQFYLSGEGKTRDLVGVVNTSAGLSAGSFLITKWSDGTNLIPGAQYQVHAEVFQNGTTQSDGNNANIPISTLSYGFDSAVNGRPGWNNVATVRAFGRSPGTLGSAVDSGVTGPLFIPTGNAQIDVGFLPFTLPAGLSTNLYRYVILRADENTPLDTTTANIPPCPTTYSVTTSGNLCILRDNIHPVTGLSNGLITVQDTSVWSSGMSSTVRPPRYRYTMVIRHLTAANASTGYLETMPLNNSAQFSVLVPVPPDDMVLVNREAVNFEMCSVQKNLTPDPLNFNRCVSLEVGATALNSGPGHSSLDLDSGYYDFGYNLFVDRYPLACNANTYVDEGRTFSAHIMPTSTVGAAGTVQYSVFNGGAPDYAYNLSNCYYSDGSSWYDVSHLDSAPSVTTSGSGPLYQAMLTNSPYNSVTNAYARRPLFAYPYWDSTTANEACSSFSTPYYGVKRIPRMREYRAFLAPPFSLTLGSSQVKDFYYSQVTAATTTNIGAAWKPGGCTLSDVTQSSSWPSGTSVPNSIAAAFTSSNLQNLSFSSLNGPAGFFIGASGNSDCVSRFGVANILESPSLNSTYMTPVTYGVTSAWYPVSDLFLWSEGTSANIGVISGLSSALDSGNVDASYDIASGLSTGYLMNILATTPNPYTTAAVTNFDVPLGLPVLSNQQGVSNYSLNRSTASNYGMSTLAVFPSGTTASFYGGVSSRWTTGFQNDKSTTYNNYSNYMSRVRCVVSAE